jgi:hypothetical protein
MLTVDEVKSAIAALKAEDGDAALAILEAMVASAAGGGEGDADESVEEELADDTEEEEMEELADDTEEEEGAEENSKLAKLLQKATGQKSTGEAVAILGKMLKEHTSLQRQNDALHLSSKRDMVVQLIKLGVETPSTAWKGPAEKRIPADRLMGESLDSMRSRIAVLSKARGKQPRPPTRSSGGPTDPDGDDEETVAQKVAKLSRRKLEQIKKQGLTPEQFIGLRKTAARRMVG